jgi:hypothetical protein
MNRFSLPVLLGCTAISFAAGFGIAWQILPTTQPDLGVAAIPEPGAAPMAGGIAHNPWSKAAGAPSTGARSAYESAGQAPHPVTDEEQKLRDQAMADPAALRKLIQRYEAENNPAARESLRSIISSVDKPEAVAFVTRLAGSNDPARRQEAYEMLQNAPESAQVRGVLKQALASEQNPAALVQAINALKPAATDPSESDAIVGQLRGLSQHADPTVRGQSLLQLAQWDKTGSGQDRYAQALSDPAPQVRQAAIFAIAQSGVRSDAVKAGLMSMITSPSESREVKGSALQALERFALSKEEFVSYSQVRSQIGGG